MELFGIAITLLTGLLTYMAWNNGRWMKQAHNDTIELLEDARRERTEIRKEVNETRREMAEIRKEVNETRKEMAEAHREMAEAHREMAQAIRYLADLVVAEGEKTRQALKS